jgi:hypothetical protein
MWEYSRRGFAGFLLSALFRPLGINGQSTATAPGATPPPSPGESAGGPASRTMSRTYRADAVILFLGIAIYRRAGVGGGQASLEETGEGTTLRRTLFFAGGSDPKHARGLSRLGWMREVVVGPASTPSEAAYFGVLTSSPEESLEHARKSVSGPASGRSIFSAVSGRNTVGYSRSAITHFEFAASAIWSDRGLIDHAKSTFPADVDWRETSWPNSPGQAPSTFLFQLATLLKQRTHRAVGRYVYSEQEYLLELEAPQPGRNHERLLPVRGKIRNLRTGHETLFRLWLEEASNSIIPVRIEFQPRSFLRLTFEALPV